jgi:hypothetical protein
MPAHAGRFSFSMSSSHSRLRTEWCPSIPRELMAGAVATFALIPEVIAFLSSRASIRPSGCSRRS